LDINSALHVIRCPPPLSALVKNLECRPLYAKNSKIGYVLRRLTICVNFFTSRLFEIGDGGLSNI